MNIAVEMAPIAFIGRIRELSYGDFPFKGFRNGVGKFSYNVVLSVKSRSIERKRSRVFSYTVRTVARNAVRTVTYVIFQFVGKIRKLYSVRERLTVGDGVLERFLVIPFNVVEINDRLLNLPIDFERISAQRISASVDPYEVTVGKREHCGILARVSALSAFEESRVLFEEFKLFGNLVRVFAVTDKHFIYFVYLTVVSQYFACIERRYSDIYGLNRPNSRIRSRDMFTGTVVPSYRYSALLFNREIEFVVAGSGCGLCTADGEVIFIIVKPRLVFRLAHRNF